MDSGGGESLLSPLVFSATRGMDPLQDKNDADKKNSHFHFIKRHLNAVLFVLFLFCLISPQTVIEG